MARPTVRTGIRASPHRPAAEAGDVAYPVSAMNVFRQQPHGSAHHRACVELPIPPGPAGLGALLPALRAAIDGTGPAIGLVPGSGPPAHRALVRAAVAPGEPVGEDIAVVAATSGSTGSPAGVLLPATALRTAARAFAVRSGQPDGHRWVSTLPLQHAGGLMVAVRSVIAGTTPIAVASLGGAARFSVADFAVATGTASDLSRHDQLPLAVSLVPPMLALLEGAGPVGLELLHQYDAVLVGGGAAPQPLLDRLRAAGVRVLTSYGLTETCGGAAFDGRALDGVTIEAEPDGRLVISGMQVALGYRDGRDRHRWASTAQGVRRFRTDDLGSVAPDGVVTVNGRVDDVVQVAGTSVSLSAIRAVLTAATEVAGAEVVAVPDPTWGSRIVAAVVPGQAEPGRPAAITAEVLADRVQRTLGKAARPREIHLVASLPAAPSGKVDRRAVLQWATHPDRVPT